MGEPDRTVPRHGRRNRECDAVTQRWTLTEQLAAFDQHAEKELDTAIHLMQAQKKYVLSLARLRLQEGYSLYGEQGWGKSFAALTQEMFEEAADLAVYAVMRRSMVLRSLGEKREPSDAGRATSSPK